MRRIWDWFWRTPSFYERRFEKIHRARVQNYMSGSRFRLQNHLIEQMRILQSYGVIPSWENFEKFGQSWAHMKRYFTEKDQKKYETEWRELFKETCDAWSEVGPRANHP